MVKTTSPQKELGVQDDRRRDIAVSCVCFPFCCGVSTQEHEILKGNVDLYSPPWYVPRTFILEWKWVLIIATKLQ